MGMMAHFEVVLRRLVSGLFDQSPESNKVESTAVHGDTPCLEIDNDGLDSWVRQQPVAYSTLRTVTVHRGHDVGDFVRLASCSHLGTSDLCESSFSIAAQTENREGHTLGSGKYG